MAGSKNTDVEGEMEGTNTSIDRPRLTPQGRASPEASGTDETSPVKGREEAEGQPDKAEG